MNTIPLADVLARPDVWRGDHFAPAPVPAMPTGFEALDRELCGGWPRGALTEFLLEGPGLGELTLLLPALATVKALGGWSLLIAPPFAPHAPAWAAAGVDLSRLVVVCPLKSRAERADTVAPSPREGAGGRFVHENKVAAEQADILWATEQALLSGSPAAVLCWADGLDPRQVRRLQVAAAGSNALVFLFRSAKAERESSVAPLRLRLSAGGEGMLRLDVLKRRGPPLGRPLSLILPRPASWRDHATDLQSRAAAPLAGPASAPTAPRHPARLSLA